MKNDHEWRQASTKVHNPLLDKESKISMYSVTYEGKLYYYSLTKGQSKIKVICDESQITTKASYNDRFTNFRDCVNKIKYLQEDDGFGDL